MKTSKIKTVRNIGRIKTLLITFSVTVCLATLMGCGNKPEKDASPAADIETMRKAAEAGDAEAQSGLGAEIQTISLEDATHGDDWGHGPRTTISGIPIISTGKRRATMTFEVTVGAPGGTYQVFLPVVKAFNAAHIGVYFDGELQVEADMFSASNVQHSILITERYIAPGPHTIKVKNLGQKKALGVDHQLSRIRKLARLLDFELNVIE